MTFYIKNFENYIDTWIETNFPPNFNIEQYYFKNNNSIKNITIAKIFDDDLYDWAVDNSQKYNWTVFKKMPVVELDCTAMWNINRKHKKYYGSYFIDPENKNSFDNEYYYLKKILCGNNKNLKNDFINRLFIKQNKVCLYADNIPLQSAVMLKTIYGERYKE